MVVGAAADRADRPGCRRRLLSARAARAPRSVTSPSAAHNGVIAASDVTLIALNFAWGFFLWLHFVVRVRARARRRSAVRSAHARCPRTQVFVIREMTEILGIHCFTIPYKSK